MEELKIASIVDRRFRELHGKSPRLFRAPGRVNLIGEHTDYNDGFVMPFAIDRETVVAAAPRSDRVVRVEAMDVKESANIDLDGPPTRLRGDWIDYVEGTVRSLPGSEEFFGADIVFASTVPIGAGLSSSAALEVAVGLAMASLNGAAVDGSGLAFAAQRAEHEFVGIRSGIMDQYTSVFGRDGHAMLLDCRSLEIDYIPIGSTETVIAVCDTKVKHELASSEYNTRRTECEKGVELLRAAIPGISTLRDVSLEAFRTHEEILPEPIRSRCRHVVTENQRTTKAADAFRQGRLEDVGALMYSSHQSLRDDYEVSSVELDALVEAARRIEGVFGARMTGGGFGGCTVNLLKTEILEKFRREVDVRYFTKFNVRPDVYVFNAAAGASEISSA